MTDGNGAKLLDYYSECQTEVSFGSYDRQTKGKTWDDGIGNTIQAATVHAFRGIV
jgi:hypothetical protein